MRIDSAMKNICSIWPTVKALASDAGVPYTTAHSWLVRGRIPSRYDLVLIEGAARLGVTITLTEIAEARAARDREDRAKKHPICGGKGQEDAA